MKVRDIVEEIVGNLPEFNEEERKSIIEELAEYFIASKGQYYMLLNNEKHYFTILKTDNDAKGNAEYFFNFLNTDRYLSSLGTLQICMPTQDGTAWEIWIGKTPFLFFQCDDFIIRRDK